MDLMNFEPENDLELAIVNAKKGRILIDSLLAEIAESDIYVSSKAEVSKDWSGFEPLLLGEASNLLVAVFSSLSRPGLHRKVAEYVLQIKGGEFFRRIPPGYGVVVNPGYVTQLIVSSDSISNLKI